MKNVFDFFSCKSWMILRKKSFDTFTNKLSLRRLEKDTTWEEALEIGEYTSNLCNTFFISQVNDYIIIDNINLERDGSTISKDISIDDDFVFNMTIDIWISYMFTEIYRAGTLIRRIEYDLNLEQNKIDVSEKGDKSQWEKHITYSPKSPIGYDEFFFPLYFMNSLGIEIWQIEKMIQGNVSIYQKSQ